MPSHLTEIERDRIAQRLGEKWSQADIAKELGRSPSSISRERKRNSTSGVYLAAQAHRRASRRRAARPLTRKLDRPDTSNFVRNGLVSLWSPQQITGRLKRQFPDDSSRHVAAQTIYTWIACQPREDRDHWRGFLRRRGRRPRCRPEKPADSVSRATIADRPAVIETRRRLGDFEGDTVLGPPGHGGLVTLVDRCSRYTIVTKVKNKESRHVERRIRRRLGPLAANQRRSLTFDNGTEFARCHLLEKHLGLRLYFAQPGCPYQRGTNENTNGLIRQLFPKGTDFHQVSHVEAARAEKLLNNRPRAILDFRTPSEVFHAKSPSSDCD